MAPPGIIGRSKGLYPQKPRWQGGLWNGMFPGASAAPTSLGGQAPMQNLGREGISPLFDAPPQSPYRPGKAPGINPMGVGQMAKFDALQGMLGQFQEGREDLRGGRMRQEELRQGQFNTNWQQYARQAPLMNLYQSPQFGQTVQGLGPGGVSPLSAEEGQYWRGRNAYSSQPGTAQMYDRFAGGPLTGQGLQGLSPSALNNDYDGQVRMQQGGYGSPLSGPLGKSRDPEFSDKAVAQRQREREMRIAADQDEYGNSARLREATARRDAWREANGMRSSSDIMGRRADRDAERSETMQNRQAQMLSRRGISPLSPEGQSLAPDLYTSIQNRRRGGGVAEPAGSPLTLTQPDGTVLPVSPVQQGSARTPESISQAQLASQALQQRPVFSHLGVAADQEVAPHELGSLLQSKIAQKGIELSDTDLQDLHQWVIQSTQAGPPPLPNDAAGQEMLSFMQSLSNIPLGDSRARAEWWSEFRKPRKPASPRPNTPSPANRPYFSDPRSTFF